MKTLVWLWLLMAPLSITCWGQLTAAREAEVAMGHYHLNVSDLAAHRAFWVDGLGGSSTKLGPMEVVRFSNALVFLREQKPTGGSRGSSINHIGFQLPDVPAMVAKLRAAGVPIITSSEVGGNRAKGDIFFSPTQMRYLAFVMAPDGLKVELMENRMLAEPIANHHIHFFTPDVEATRAWYVRMFGAEPGRRGTFEAADLPGVNLTFSPSDSALPGTKGRVLDHIGFEIRNLEAYCRKLKASGVRFDLPYKHLRDLKLSIAFLTDPWGNYIELTEGLAGL